MSGEPLRWVRCPEDGRLHLLSPADVVVATTQGHAGALCGIRLGAECLTLTNGSAAALCPACIAGIDPPVSRPQWAFSPFDLAAHLLLRAGDHPHGVLNARCGAVLPTIAAVHGQPTGRRCIQCDLYSLADEHAPGSFARRDD